jgi:uridine kinase
MRKPFVISVSGVSGSGKTTVARNLEEQLTNAAVVSFDDYGDNVYLSRDINDWSADGEDANEWYVEPIVNDLNRLLKKPLNYIILDFPFGRGNFLVGQDIDLSVFIDTPLDIALARRIIRDYTSHMPERNKTETSLGAIDTEMRHYLSHSRSTYARMAQTQKPVSDLVIDGAKTPNEITDEIVKYIGSTPENGSSFKRALSGENH